MTRRSITRLIIFVGRTQVMCQSKQQGTVKTSIYEAKFMAIKTAVERVMDVCYMLHCLGVKISKPTQMLDNNRSVIINSTVPSSVLKKKHVTISYYMTCE
eukprot:2019184-Ditylum_brightwellii.AAC.1